MKFYEVESMGSTPLGGDEFYESSTHYKVESDTKKA